MSIGPIPLPITGQKIADTFGFLANGPASNLNSYRGVELRDIRTDLIRFLPTNGVIKYSDFENLYLPAQLPTVDLTLSGPQDVTVLEEVTGRMTVSATINWNLGDWPDSIPLPASYRRRARWEFSEDNGATWQLSTPTFTTLESNNTQTIILGGFPFRDNRLYRAEVWVESLDTDGNTLTSARRYSRAARFRVNELGLPNPTIDFRGSLRSLTLNVQVDTGGSLVQAASGRMSQSISGIFLFNRVTDSEASPGRRPISSPLFEWSWRVRTTGSGNGTQIAGGVVNGSGVRISGDFPGNPTTLAGVRTVASGVAGGLGGLQFDNISNNAYDGYEFQARVRIIQNASNPVQEISDSDQTNWARLTVNLTQNTPTFNGISVTTGTLVDTLDVTAQGPLLRIRTANAIGKQVRIRVLNESSPRGGLTRQFDGNFPQFGPLPPTQLLRGNFIHTIYSDEDVIGMTGSSNALFTDRGVLRGLNRFLPTSEPCRIEPVNPAEWGTWTGTNFNITINNDTQEAESTRTSPTVIFEGGQVNVDVLATDVVNDGATFRWTWSGFNIGSGPNDSFPTASGTYPMTWRGGPTAESDPRGYRGSFSITANPSPGGLTSGDVEEKDRGSIRVLDQFNNLINQHAVVVNRYVAPPPSLPAFPNVNNVSGNVLPFRNAQIRLNTSGTAQVTGFNPPNTQFNQVFNRRWTDVNVDPALRSRIRWSARRLSFSVQNLQANISNRFANPALWSTYATLDPTPGATSFLVGLNAPGDIYRESNGTDLRGNASWEITVTLAGEPGFSETFIASVSMSFPIRSNPPDDGGAFDGAFD